MYNTDFEKYIDEMKKMSKKAALPAEEYSPKAVTTAAEPKVNPSEDSNMSGSGYILVNVTTIQELYPVQNARVTIFKGQLESLQRIDDDLTDQSGKTKSFRLPAPPLSLAQNSENTLPVYATYNILTEADGYLPTINYNAAVFDGVTSIQNVNLIPKTAFNENDTNIFDESNDYNL